MLLQTNSYLVPSDKRAVHQRLMRRFRQTLKRLGCAHFEVYEQAGPNWTAAEAGGRYVQILRFTDRRHQLSVQQAERSDPAAQAVIADFCDLINFPYQQQQGLFAVGFYTSLLPTAPRVNGEEAVVTTDAPEADEPETHVPEQPTNEPAPVPRPALRPAPARSPTVERHHEMIDSVTIVGPVTAPGELFDVLEADAPVDHLEGTPPETEPLTEPEPLVLTHLPPGTGAGVPVAEDVFLDDGPVDRSKPAGGM